MIHVPSYAMESPREGCRIERKTDASLTAEQLRWAGVTPGIRVLDLGCAARTTTRLAAQLVGPSGLAVGVDASRERVDQARAWSASPANVEYRQGQAESIPADDGECDVAWSRFLFEYLREPAAVLREMIRVTKPGGIVAVADLDGNCVWHDTVDEGLEREIAAAVASIAKIGFDPHVGRRLFGLAAQAGLRDLSVEVLPYRVVAGTLTEDQQRLWCEKLETAASTLQVLGWSAARAESLVRRYMDHLCHAGTFSYSVLISVRGRVPSP